MTYLKASRKGTRLNDVRYFRLPFSRTRKRMTMMHVIPRLGNSESDLSHVVQDSVSLRPEKKPAKPPEFGIGMKPRDRGQSVQSKQSSIEIAFVMCRRSFEETDQNDEEHQDVCVETEVLSTGNRRSLTRLEDVVAIVSEDSKKSIQLPQIEDDPSVKRSCGDRVIETKRREKSGDWWKDSGQTILQFFAKILRKRVGMTAKGPADHVLLAGERVKCVSRDGRGHNRRSFDKGVRLRRVSNGYIATQACRYEENQRGSIARENKSRKEQQQQQQHRPSILSRQIQRTRDKNLRVALLEREFRARLPNIARKSIRPIVSRSINVRQLSSPLC